MNGASVDQLYQAFANHGPAIQAALMTGALELFGALAVIELTLSIGKSLAHKTDLLDIIYLVTNQLITIGFFLFLLQNWAGFAKAITDSGAVFGANASTAMGGTATMMPLGMMDAGINIAKHVWAGMALTRPFLSWLLYINGIVVILVFAYFAALMIEVLIECFFASYVGVVMMAFGGTVYTRDMAVSQVRYAISVAIKRLTMQLIAGVAEAIVNGWATTIQNNTASFTWTDCGLMLAVPIVLARLAMTMPKIAQDVVNGSHISAHGNLFSTGAAMAKAATAAALSVTGAAAAVTAGAKVASNAMSAMQAAGTAPSSRIGQAAKMVGMASSATGKALASDVGSRLTGSYGSTHGYRGFRVAAAINGKKQ